MKSMFASKIVIVNLIALVLEILASPKFLALVPADWLPYVAAITPILSILFRFSGGSMATLQVKS
jgi:hypothetical protein